MMLDQDILQRMEEVAKLPEEDKAYIFQLVDVLIRDFKNKKAYAH